MVETKKYFRTKFGKIRLPVFFPDATRGVVRTIDSTDIANTKTTGVLVNTLHLHNGLSKEVLANFEGISEFMKFRGGYISDSGGFQVGSLVKKNPDLGKVTDYGVIFKMLPGGPSPRGKKVILTPEKSIEFQMTLGVDMIVALDDFDAPDATISQARDSVRRTIIWAERSKKAFENICKLKKIPRSKRPYILGVIQGGRNKSLRKYCIEELVKIGFDGLGYGGEEKVKGQINLDLAKYIADLVPKNYFLYALGVGKPHDIVNMVQIGWSIFDCVLPTRDARHKRLYKFNAATIAKIDLKTDDFYSNYVPDKLENLRNKNAVSDACDCLLCKNYSRSYLAYLFKIHELTALRLATIHNLRFYSLLMEKIREQKLLRR